MEDVRGPRLGRAVQAVLISLLSTDEARGAKSICASVLDSL